MNWKDIYDLTQMKTLSEGKSILERNKIIESIIYPKIKEILLKYESSTVVDEELLIQFVELIEFFRSFHIEYETFKRLFPSAENNLSNNSPYIEKESVNLIRSRFFNFTKNPNESPFIELLNPEVKNTKTDFSLKNISLREDEIVFYILFLKDSEDYKLVVIQLYKDNKLKIEIYVKKLSINLDSYAHLSYLINKLLTFCVNRFSTFYLIEEIKNFVSTKDSGIKEDTKELVSKLNEGNINEYILKIRKKALFDVINELSIHFSQLLSTGDKKVYLSPFGEINRLPLHIAILKIPNSSVKVAYIPTLKFFLYREKQFFNKEVLIIHTGEEDFKREAIAVKSILEKKGYTVEILNVSNLKENEKLKAVKEKLESKKWNIVHFILHGKYNEIENHSYLILSEHTKLSSKDIFSMNLNINLVFMGACETFTTKKVKGLDYIDAIEKAFLFNNVDKVISTYYAVLNDGAEHFSIKFFSKVENLRKFEDIYRDATLELSKAENEGYEYVLFRYTKKGSDTYPN